MTKEEQVFERILQRLENWAQDFDNKVMSDMYLHDIDILRDVVYAWVEAVRREVVREDNE